MNKKIFSVVLLLSAISVEAVQTRLAQEVNQISSEDIYGNKQGKVSSPFPGSHALVGLEFLYWQANEDHLTYGNMVTGISKTNGATALDEEELNLRFEWNPGFRVGLGYQFANADDWDLNFIYTYMHNRAHGSKTADLNKAETVFASWDPLFLGIVNIKGQAKWKLNYNVLDAVVGKAYLIGTRLSARPFLGLRGAMIRQHYSANYASFFNGQNSNFKARSRFEGIGIRAGGDLFWHFTKHWGLCGDLSGALLYGQFNVSQSGLGNFPGKGDSFSIVPSGMKNRHFWKTVATIQAAIGFTWERFYHADKRRFALSLKYEINEWFKQNQFFTMRNYLTAGNGGGGDQVPILAGSATDGDLGFQGATLRAELDF
jgi:hypothetical protein